MSGIIQVAPTAFTTLTLLNSFTELPGGYSLKFRILPNNLLETNGIVLRSSGSPAVNTPIATLPIRPSIDKICYAQASGFTMGRFDILASNGNIIWVGGSLTDYFIMHYIVPL